MKLLLLQTLNQLIFYIFFPFTIAGLILEFSLIPFISFEDKLDSFYCDEYWKVKKNKQKRIFLFLLWGFKNMIALIFFPITLIEFILMHLSQPFIDFRDAIECRCCIEVRKQWEEKQKGAVNE